MRVVYLIIIMALVGVGLFFLIPANEHVEVKRVIVGDGLLKVEVADSDTERAEGLMWREHMPDDRGMLFLFNEASALSFWNKNTLIPLDVIWIADDVVIGIDKLPAIESDAPVTISSPSLADKVLEVNEGWSSRFNVSVGDTVLIME